MALNLKKLTDREELLAPGHSACAACAGPTVLRQVLLATETPVVCACSTGCMEVVTTIYPFTSWRVPFIHSAFENCAATITGVETAYRALKKRGRIPDKPIKFIGFGGDGGTYDIGLQSLSGALERGHDFLFVCYNNEAYMNTGIQRSGATPKGAETNTAPAGAVKAGKEQNHKDLTGIVVAHNVPYAAQASPHNFRDLMRKVQTGLNAEGPAFMNVISPCHRGWRYPQEKTMQVAKLAVDTCFWPLFEIVDGQWKINYRPKEKKPITDYLKMQGRFKHLSEPRNEHTIAELQAEVDRRWEVLLKRDAEREEAEAAAKSEQAPKDEAAVKA